MPFDPGTQLGPYEILSPLGAGGMGEVYKARDTRLDRLVAIKVLPDHIAKREDLRARFEREARTVASLNHPHICVLHDIGPNYMVMELIEGETLEARIGRGPIPLGQALPFAIQIADALDRAHRAGVTHRDIKPGNIMLTRDGVKILDFGLAKSTPRPGPTDATAVATLTTEGTVLGTPQYMAPEQFEGKEADARADIWAFGAVLYEMVTGRKAFEGRSYTSLVGAILSADPAPMALKPFTPTWLERMVQRCLQKDPEERWQAMRDVVLELKSPPAEHAGAPAKSSLWPQGAAAVLLLTTLLFAGLWMRNSSSPRLPVKLEVTPPEGHAFASRRGGSAVSPDGQTVAFVAANEKGEPLLFVRPLDSLEARALPGTEGAGRPFWSPDGRSVAFSAHGKLKRIDLAGGAPVVLYADADSNGGDWSEAGVILLASLAGRGIERIPASGGAPVYITQVNREAGEIQHYYPQFLPGGKDFLYLVLHNDPRKSGIAFGSLDGRPAGPPAIVGQTLFKARYDAPSGRLLYIQGAATLLAERLELNPPRLSGDAAIVAQGVRTSIFDGYAEYSLSSNGTLFYGRGEEKVRFGWRDRAGKTLDRAGDPVQAGYAFSLSPDGTRVAYSVGPIFTQTEVWVMEPRSGLSTRITFTGGLDPQWSADGRSLYFNSPTGIYRKASDGSGAEVLLAKASQTDFVTSVSPDGKSLLFGQGDIMKLSLTGDSPTNNKTELYLKASYRPVFSPDGRWVAYRSAESGREEVYVQGYPDKRGKWLVSPTAGSGPVWRPDGKELYGVGPDGTLMASSIELQNERVRSGRPQPLFRMPDTGRFFQPSRDGQRFLTYEPETAAGHHSMVVLLNWAARLGR